MKIIPADRHKDILFMSIEVRACEIGQKYNPKVVAMLRPTILPFELMILGMRNDLRSSRLMDTTL